MTLRRIDRDDYAVHEDGQHVGRIRFANGRIPRWNWNPFGQAETLDEAKAAFRAG